jgi:hypothetical protein
MFETLGYTLHVYFNHQFDISARRPSLSLTVGPPSLLQPSILHVHRNSIPTALILSKYDLPVCISYLGARSTELHMFSQASLL